MLLMQTLSMCTELPHTTTDFNSSSVAFHNSLLLFLVVVHNFVHSVVFTVNSVFVFVEIVQLALQFVDVGLQHGFNVRGAGSLALQQLPLSFQHFVLLLQVSHLRHNEEVPTKSDKHLLSVVECN